MKNLWWSLLLLVICAVCGGFAASRPQANELGTYQGTFQWSDETVVQSVTFRLGKPDEQGNVVGAAAYTDSGSTVTVKGQLSSDLTVELWESDPQGPAVSSFICDGSHRGSFTPDFQSLNCVYTSESEKRQGALHLTRAK